MQNKKRAHKWFKDGESFVETCVMAAMEPNYVQKKIDQYFKSRQSCGWLRLQYDGLRKNFMDLNVFKDCRNREFFSN